MARAHARDEVLVDRGGVRRVDRRDLDLTAPQAGGDLQALQRDPVGLDGLERAGDLGLRDPEQPQHALAQLDGAGQRLVEQSRRPARSPTSAAARAAGRAARAPTAGRPPRAAGPGAPARSRPARAPARRRGPSPACGSPPGRPPVDVRRPAHPQPLQDGPDALLQPRVERQAPSGEVGHDRRGEVVGGRPEATAGDDQIESERRLGLERRTHVLRAVADDEDLRAVDPRAAQPLRQPGPVGVADDPGQDLRSRDDDAGACAHEVQVGRADALNTRGLRPGRRSYPMPLAVDATA